MSTQEKLTATIGLLAFAALVIYILRQHFRNQKIFNQKSFYTGHQHDQEKRKRFSYWLPLFLYRRRRRINGKKLAIVKNLRRYNEKETIRRCLVLQHPQARGKS